MKKGASRSLIERREKYLYGNSTNFENDFKKFVASQTGIGDKEFLDSYYAKKNLTDFPLKENSVLDHFLHFVKFD